MLLSRAEQNEYSAFVENRLFGGIHLSARWVVFTILAIAYGSLIPFSIDLSSFQISNLFGLARLCFARPSLEDLVANLALYAPLGFVLFLSAQRRMRGILFEFMLAGIIGFVVSIVLESAQTGIHGRVGSWVDVVLNTISCALGFIGAAIATSIFAIVLDYLGNRRMLRPYRLLWLGVAVMVLAVSIAPFDFVTSTSELHDSLRKSVVSLSGISDAVQAVGLCEFLVSSLRSVFTFTLIGFLGALAAGERSSDRMEPEPVVVGTVGLAVLIEILQLFTGSHVFDVFDVISGVIGAVIGVTCGTLVVLKRPESVASWNPRKAFPTRMILIAVFSQALLLFVPTLSRLTEASMNSVSLVHCTLPFESLWRRPMSIASQEMMAQVIRFGSLVLGVAIVLRRHRLPYAWLFSTATVVVAALTIASLKIAVSQGRLDFTNVFLALFAAILVSKIYPFTRSYFFRLAGNTTAV